MALACRIPVAGLKRKSWFDVPVITTVVLSGNVSSYFSPEGVDEQTEPSGSPDLISSEDQSETILLQKSQSTDPSFDTYHRVKRSKYGYLRPDQMQEVLHFGREVELRDDKGNTTLIATRHAAWLDSGAESGLLVFLKKEEEFVPAPPNLFRDYREYAMTLATPVAFMRNKLPSEDRMRISTFQQKSGDLQVLMNITKRCRTTKRYQTKSYLMPSPKGGRIRLPHEWKKALQQVKGFWRSEYEEEWDKWWQNTHLNALVSEASLKLQRASLKLHTEIQNTSRRLTAALARQTGTSALLQQLKCLQESGIFPIRSENHPFTGAPSYVCLQLEPGRSVYCLDWMTPIDGYDYLRSANRRRYLVDAHTARRILEGRAHTYENMTERTGWMGFIYGLGKLKILLQEFPDTAHNYMDNMLRALALLRISLSEDKIALADVSREFTQLGNSEQLVFTYGKTDGRTKSFRLPLPQSEATVPLHEWLRSLQRIEKSGAE